MSTNLNPGPHPDDAFLDQEDDREYPDDRDQFGPPCARCGAECEWEDCWNCGGEGTDGHECGEDCCCCADPDDNVTCDWCGGKGGELRCTSTPEWCEANPLPGQEKNKARTAQVEQH